MLGSHPGLDAPNGRIDRDVLAALFEIAVVKAKGTLQLSSAPLGTQDDKLRLSLSRLGLQRPIPKEGMAVNS